MLILLRWLNAYINLAAGIVIDCRSPVVHNNGVQDGIERRILLVLSELLESHSSKLPPSKIDTKELQLGY